MAIKKNHPQRPLNVEAKFTMMQQTHIRQNHQRQTIGEMAAAIKADPACVLDYCDRYDLNIRKVYEKRASEKDKKKRGIFFQDKNWMP